MKEFKKSQYLDKVLSQFNNAFALASVIPILICLYLLTAKFFSIMIFVGMNGLYFIFAIIMALLGLLLGRHLIRGVVEELIASNQRSERLLVQLEHANEITKEELHQRKQVEKALRHSEQKFRRIFRESLDIIMVVSCRDGRILQVNQAVKRIMGFEVDALVGQHWSIIFKEMEKPHVDQFIDDVFQQGALYISQEFTRVDGSSCFMDLTATVIPWEPGKAILASFRDCTERKHVEQIKDEFVSTVSHELRTPMAVIRESVSQINEGLCGEVNEEQKELLALALTGLDRLGRMVTDLLDLSRLEAKRVVLNRSERNLSAIVEEVLAILKQRSDLGEVKLLAEVPEAPVLVYVDADKINQVLTNLVGNALKFTQSGSVRVRVIDQQGAATCEVIDSGKGIDPQDLPHAFEKFRQFGHEAVTGERGTGLGLAICKGLVEYHHGTIEASSSPGRGTTISFTLPKYTERQVFREFIGECLQKAALGGTPLTVLHIACEYEVGQKAPSAELLAALLRVIKKKMPHQINDSMQGTSALLGVVFGMQPEDVANIAMKLYEICYEQVSNQEAGGSFQLKIRSASYPDAGRTTDAILNALERGEVIHGGRAKRV